MRYVTSIEECKRACAEIAEWIKCTLHPCIALDTETYVQTKYLSVAEASAVDPHTSSIRLIQMRPFVLNPKHLCGIHETFIFDLMKIGQTVPKDVWFCFLQSVLDDPKVMWCGHNLKFEIKFLWICGFVLPGTFFDTFLGNKLIRAGLAAYKNRNSLKAVCADLLGLEVDKTEQTSDWSAPELSTEQLEYAEADVTVMLPLVPKLTNELIGRKLLSRDLRSGIAALEFECLRPFARMELNGMKLDVQGWNELLHKYRPILEDQANEVLGHIPDVYWQYSLADEEAPPVPTVTIGNAKYLTKVLQSMNVPDPLNKGELLSSTDDKVLSQLPSGTYPLVDAIMKWRKTKKLVESYLETLPAKINPATNRIHADFKQIGADSGRSALANPNLQQIPRDGEFRSKFIAEPDQVYVIADFKQIEVRVIAELSGDKKLIGVFKDGKDIYSATAAEVNGVPYESIGKKSKERQDAKAIVLGFQFGMGAARFQNYAKSEYGIELSLEECKQFRRKFFAVYHQLAAWHQKMAGRIQEDRAFSCRTLTGRIRQWMANEKGAYNALLNAPVQGTSADITKMALIGVDNRIEYFRAKGVDAKLIMVVHDEIVIETTPQWTELVSKILSEEMIRAGESLIKNVPIEVDVSIGTNWADK